MNKIKHVLGISGGKDSAALALYMREKYPELDIEYFFTDTGKGLPEVYEFIDKLEVVLGKKVIRLKYKLTFDEIIAKNNFLPSFKARWCTRYLKILPMEEWLKTYLNDGYTVYSYVGLRADEPTREGAKFNRLSIETKLPFQEDGVDLKGVHAILDKNGVGLPKYYEWRSRSGCTFCFFQRRIEWVGLLERHPEAFKEAMAYEKDGYTWIKDESLEQLSKPERVAQIKENWARKQKKMQDIENPLYIQGILDLYNEDKQEELSCVFCHK